ncbi:MAG: porin family protein [Bacteroidales bacterium]
MKKIAFLLSLLIIVLPVFGQEKDLSFGLAGGLESNNYDFNKTTTGYRNHDLSSKIAFSTGIEFKYHIHEKIFCKSGLWFYQQGYDVVYNFIALDPGDPLVPKESELFVISLQVPLKIGYEFTMLKKIRFNYSAGLIPHYQLSKNETTIFADNSEKESELLSNDLNKFQIGIILDLGVEYHLTDKIYISFIPFLFKSLTKLNSDLMNSGKITYGGQIGIQCKL